MHSNRGVTHQMRHASDLFRRPTAKSGWCSAVCHVANGSALLHLAGAGSVMISPKAGDRPHQSARSAAHRVSAVPRSGRSSIRRHDCAKGRDPFRTGCTPRARIGYRMTDCSSTAKPLRCPWSGQPGRTVLVSATSAACWPRSLRLAFRVRPDRADLIRWYLRSASSCARFMARPRTAASPPSCAGSISSARSESTRGRGQDLPRRNPDQGRLPVMVISISRKNRETIDARGWLHTATSARSTMKALSRSPNRMRTSYHLGGRTSRRRRSRTSSSSRPTSPTPS